MNYYAAGRRYFRQRGLGTPEQIAEEGIFAEKDWA
jgi:hypothetical protein